jgi:hypothetical protein
VFVHTTPQFPMVSYGKLGFVLRVFNLRGFFFFFNSSKGEIMNCPCVQDCAVEVMALFKQEHTFIHL